MRLSHRIGLIVILLLVAAAIAADSPSDDFERQLAKVRSTVLAGTKGYSQKAAAFEQASAAASDDSRMQAALLEEAFAHALAGIPSTACVEIAKRSLKRLGELDPQRKDLWARKQIDLLRRSYLTTRDKKAKTASGAVLLKALLAAAKTQEAERRWTEATTTLAEAARMARLVAKEDAPEILRRHTRARHFASTRRQADRLKKTLADKPDDKAIRERLISTLIVDLDEPVEASEHLTKDVDESWRTQVPLAAGQVADLQADAARKTSDWYAETLIKRAKSSYSRAIVTSRAVAWLERCADLAKGQDALLAKIAADKLRKKLVRLPWPPPPRANEPVSAPAAGEPEKIAISVYEPWPFKRPVIKGQKLRIKASGRWRIMPKGKWHGPNGKDFHLRGRFDDGEPFRVGHGITLDIAKDGMLHLGMYEGGKYSNNRGGITVTIEEVK
jgi:hypothetical protein